MITKKDDWASTFLNNGGFNRVFKNKANGLLYTEDFWKTYYRSFHGKKFTFTFDYVHCMVTLKRLT